MSQIAVEVRGLGKRYSIGATRERYVALRDVITNGVRRAARRLVGREKSRPSTTDFWALRDVSFEVREGECVGIIGRNGAGKSTLLKILSRITEPTEGEARLRGRVASLLEVGTGFHPELTGRENVFLNGAILGMSRREISKKFDEIVSFAEIEKFLDTPVKRYSSGMYTRLAFAVAAHLEPEILVVDEVLAVGDAAFQKKCLGKMSEVAKGGRTVLFVSHNMGAVESLCGHAIRLADGSVADDSFAVRQTIERYLRSSQGTVGIATKWTRTSEDIEHPAFSPERFLLCDEAGAPIVNAIRNDENVLVCIEGTVETLDAALKVGYSLYSEQGDLLFWTLSTDTPEPSWPRPEIGRCRFVSYFPRHLLNDGNYRLELNISLHHRDWFCEPGRNAPAIVVTVRGGLSDSPYWMSARPGSLAPLLPWKVSRLTERSLA